MPLQPEVFRIPDAAVILGVHPATLRGLIRTGAIKSVRIGGRQLVSRIVLDAIVANGAGAE